MRPVSLRNGTLVLCVPTRLADRAATFECRWHGREWAVRLVTTDGEVLYGAGTYEPDGPAIHVSGGAVETLPAWWPVGEPEQPEPWVVAQLFGTSSQPIAIGSD